MERRPELPRGLVRPRAGFDRVRVLADLERNIDAVAGVVEEHRHLPVEDVEVTAAGQHLPDQSWARNVPDVLPSVDKYFGETHNPTLIITQRLRDDPEPPALPTGGPMAAHQLQPPV